jgi:nitrite reductase/ring-hydroxylating ferredoxin subunit
MVQKIDDLKHPPVIGEFYLVPCMVEDKHVVTRSGPLSDDILAQEIHIYPVINHTHNDIENGQKDVHYHRDYRFTPMSDKYKLGDIIKSSRIYPATDDIFKNKKLEYFVMECIDVNQKIITPVSMISNSKLKHKCIHKGKCPHRGYDLSQEVPRNGKITCPLHGLQFDSITRALMNDPALSHILEQINSTRDLIDSEDDWVNEHRGNTGILRNQLKEYEKQLHDKYPDEYVKYVQERVKIIEQAKLKLSVYNEMQNKASLEPTTH